MVLSAWLLARHGTAPFRLGWTRAGSTVLCGVLLIGANALLFVAERRVPIGLASLIFASVPLWLVVLRSTTGDRPPRASLAGTAVGFIGVALLLRPGGDATVTGVLLVVAAALSWALGTFLSSRLPMPGDAVTTAGVQGLTGGLLLLPIGMALSDGESLNPADWSTRSLLGLLYLVIFGSIFGYTAYVWLVANVPLGTVATYAYVNPLVAITLGVIFLHEVVTWQIAVGRGGDPDLGRRRHPQGGATAAGRGDPAARRVLVRHLTTFDLEPGAQSAPRTRVDLLRSNVRRRTRGRRSRPDARGHAAAACRSRRASPPRPPRSRRRSGGSPTPLAP